MKLGTIRLQRALLVMALSITAKTAAAEARILVVGDSWTPPMVSRLETALVDRGFEDAEVIGGATTIGGTTAAQWATPAFLALITEELLSYPTIDIVHLSMGGNDILGASWSTPGEFAALLNVIFDNIDVVVDHIESIRPNARIALCSYDYVQNVALNDELGMFGEEAIVRAEAAPNYYYINNLGLMHYTYGYPSQFEPSETPYPGNYPDYSPLMGGDPGLPGPPVAFQDAIHLTPDAYLVLAERCVDEFYASWIAAPASVPVATWPSLILLLIIGARAVRRRAEEE